MVLTPASLFGTCPAIGTGNCLWHPGTRRGQTYGEFMYVKSDDGCWLWTGPTCAGGRYGRMPGGGRLKMAHRHAYEQSHGPIPDGMLVCHRCDNGLCVNPDHLFIGSHSDNMKDAAQKSRLPHLLDQSGENNSNSKYTKELADKIRCYYAEHKPSFSVLAKKFGLKSKGHAHSIVTGRIWR